MKSNLLISQEARAISLTNLTTAKGLIKDLALSDDLDTLEFVCEMLFQTESSLQQLSQIEGCGDGCGCASSNIKVVD